MLIKDSFIISHLISFFMYLKNAFSNSVYYKISNKIGDFFGKLFSGSGIYAFFTKDIKETNGSLLEKIVNAVFGLFYNIFHKPFAWVAEKAKCGMLLAVGLSAQIGIQVALNLAVVTNLMPNTGISLPFFSYGGSSLVMLLAQMGVVLSVSRQSRMQKEESA